MTARDRGGGRSVTTRVDGGPLRSDVESQVDRLIDALLARSSVIEEPLRSRRRGHRAGRCESSTAARQTLPDAIHGRVLEARLCPDHGEILDWLHQLRGPVRVAYEVGPTGFVLARALAAAEIDCVVAAPSKLIRPAWDRIKTDAREAAHLTRLLRLGEITAVTVPEAEVEAVRSRACSGRCAHFQVTSPSLIHR